MKRYRTYKVILKALLLLAVVFVLSVGVTSAQVKDVSEMNKEEITSLTYDELLGLSMEDLVYIAEKLGVSVDELLNMKVTVASKVELTPRESPGIVTVITREEIRKSGARDLIDVLALIPGFDFGYDVGGVVSLGLRGNWVHEGKVLLLLDGQEMNESFYNNMELGNHYAVDQIKKIEIIRGPGSAIYGGSAELGVINVITREGSDLNGFAVNGQYGRMVETQGRLNGSLSGGAKINDWVFSVSGFYGDAKRSDGQYVNWLSYDTLDLAKTGGKISTQNVNVALKNKNFFSRVIFDEYQSHYFEETEPQVNEFRTLLGEMGYIFRVGEKLTITPKFNYKYSRPYHDDVWWRVFKFYRYRASTSINYDASEKINFSGGVEYYYDYGTKDRDSAFFYHDSSSSLGFSNITAYAQCLMKTKYANIIIGGRVDHHDDYGFAAAPRLGLTKIFNNLHLKILYSGAYRTPAFGNIEAGKDIRPEYATVTELEAGYKINDNLFFTANLYDISIYKTILYFDDGDEPGEPGVTWGYMNAERSGSRGLEFEFRARYEKAYAIMSYSYFNLAGKNIPEVSIVPDHENQLLGFSPHKFTLNTSWQATKNLSLSPSVVIIGKRFAYFDLDEDYNPVIEEFAPDYQINFNICYDNILISGLNASVGVYDITNRKIPILQPYNGYSPGFPGRSREIMFRLVYEFNKEK